ncbi:uncharacterized protein CEXT_128391 [Caerostris extrusa]|uniref:STING ligand-binding domain-containing protein n=1 Tax=Caerostris extrusa TaxID=172846 RepID=A0AAV4S9K6_CAEEX|nr:uncharacterized protein CEXT_128391 [Caerostris extrusa]
MRTKSSLPDFNYIGYGAAIWYYKNYLDRFLPENFWERVREYESRHQIALPRKLYILCPKSCRVKQYIDNIDGIEWCRELTSLLVNVGGVVERRYNISIYRMEYEENVLHCAIEYAQPLKNLLTLKENGRITVEEMNTQRDLFCKNLNKMLRDSKDSYQACELIEFNDEINEPNEVLFDINSIQQFLRNRGP